jgi:hypothetical protein
MDLLQLLTFLFLALEEVSADYDKPAVLLRELRPSLFVEWCLGGFGGTGSVCRLWKMENFFIP